MPVPYTMVSQAIGTVDVLTNTNSGFIYGLVYIFNEAFPLGE